MLSLCEFVVPSSLCVNAIPHTHTLLYQCRMCCGVTFCYLPKLTLFGVNRPTCCKHLVYSTRTVKQLFQQHHCCQFLKCVAFILKPWMCVEFPPILAKSSSIWLGMSATFGRNVRSHWKWAIADGGISKGNCLFRLLTAVELIKCPVLSPLPPLQTLMPK